MKNEVKCVRCQKWFWAWDECRNVCRQCVPEPALDKRVLEKINGKK